MPLYTFICKCAHTQEVVRPMSKSDLPVLCEKCGFVMKRDYKADFGKQLRGDLWPMASYAAGVHPKQIPEMRKFDAEHGIPTDYTPDGDPILRSRKHRKQYCEAHGLYDRNGTDKDPLPARCRKAG